MSLDKALTMISFSDSHLFKHEMRILKKIKFDFLCLFSPLKFLLSLVPYEIYQNIKLFSFLLVLTI